MAVFLENQRCFTSTLMLKMDPSLSSLEQKKKFTFYGSNRDTVGHPLGEEVGILAFIVGDLLCPSLGLIKKASDLACEWPKNLSFCKAEDL